MYVHQYIKGDPNQFTDGAIIATNAHTHSPPTQTLFLPQIYAFSTCIFICIYISKPLYRGKQNFYSLQTSPIHKNI